VAEEVGTHRRGIEHQPLVPEPHRIEEARPRSRLSLEGQDAVVVLTEPELSRGAQHAFGQLAADFALLDDEATRQRRADRREGILGTRHDVRGAAHDVAAVGGPIVDGAEAEPVRVRVRSYLLDRRDDDVAQVCVQRLDRVRRGPELGEPAGEVVHLELAAQKRLEPSARDVHRPPPAAWRRKRMSPL
jgi:hypothetical protein